MPQIGGITVTEGLSAGLDFEPEGVEGAIAKWRDFTSSVPALRPSLSLSLTTPEMTKGKYYKPRLRAFAPVEKTVTEGETSVGTGTVARINSAEVSFQFAADSTLEERTNLCKLMGNLLLGDVEVGSFKPDDVVRNLKPVY